MAAGVPTLSAGPLDTAPVAHYVAWLLGHSSLNTTSRYLRIATSKVCTTASPLDALKVATPIMPDLVPA